MAFVDRAERLLAYATLERTRALLAARGGRAMAVFFGVLYALISMLVGGMLVLTPNYSTPLALVLWTGNGSQPWNYPALIVSERWGVLALPFFLTLSMVVVSIGVGIGMAVSVLLLFRLVRQRRAELGRPAAMGSIAGLTPAMIALVTLGACCSTTAAASAGLGVVAQTSGTSIANLLANNWYLGVFQMVILWVALLAQEQLIVVYGVLFGLSKGPSTVEGMRANPGGARRLASTALRAALVVGGVTWTLAILVAWTTVSPGTAGPGLWVAWVLQHLVPGVFAVVVGLFPRAVVGDLLEEGRPWGARFLRATLFVSGLSLLAWVPPAIAGWGVHGLVNELLGSLGAPAGWGAVAPGLGAGTALLLRWVLGFGLLGVFGLAVAIAPEGTLRAIIGSSPSAGPIEELMVPRGGPHPLSHPGEP
jgi:hypothetical protein